MKQLCIMVGLITLMTMSQAHSQISMYKGQALFIWNFTKHIKWQNNSPTFIIGVYGKSELNEELTTNLKGKTVEGKAIEIKMFKEVPSPGSCQILYVASSKSKDLPSLLSSPFKDMLIVTEDDLASKGAGISFLTVDEKLKFKINADALTKSGLQVSSGLLSLALKM